MWTGQILAKWNYGIVSYSFLLSWFLLSCVLAHLEACNQRVQRFSVFLDKAFSLARRVNEDFSFYLFMLPSCICGLLLWLGTFLHLSQCFSRIVPVVLVTVYKFMNGRSGVSIRRHEAFPLACGLCENPFTFTLTCSCRILYPFSLAKGFDSTFLLML